MQHSRATAMFVAQDKNLGLRHLHEREVSEPAAATFVLMVVPCFGSAVLGCLQPVHS
jgi:hypothetical protein